MATMPTGKLSLKQLDKAVLQVCKRFHPAGFTQARPWWAMPLLFGENVHVTYSPKRSCGN